MGPGSTLRFAALVRDGGGDRRRALAFPDKTRFLPAMSSDAPVLQQPSEPAENSGAPSRLSRYVRPMLGLLLPLTLALGWELVVRLG